VFICGWCECVLLFSIFCILSILSVTKYSGDLKEINLHSKDFSILLDML
jgi:hypothetical protein